MTGAGEEEERARRRQLAVLDVTVASERAAWMRRFADAIGSHVGTPSTRYAFADDLLDRLAGALPRAVQAEYSLDDAERLERLSRAADVAAQALLREVERTWGSTPIRRGEARHAVERAAEALRAYARSAEKEADETRERLPRRSGPRNATALAVAETVARLYVRHFDRQPAHSGQKIHPTPFDRVCDVVEALLRTLTRRVDLTRRVRAQVVKEMSTIKEASLAALRPRARVVVPNS